MKPNTQPNPTGGVSVCGNKGQRGFKGAGGLIFHTPLCRLMHKNASFWCIFSPMNLQIIILALLLVLPLQAWAKGEHIETAFSPAQGATALIVKTIDSAQASIQVAAYSFTSRPIAEALVRAHKKGIDVRVVLNKNQRDCRYCMAKLLQKNAVPTRFDRRYAIMHNKFMIVDRHTLQTGSFNYTSSAEKRNAENVMVLHNAPKTIRAYDHQWTKLWGESLR